MALPFTVEQFYGVFRDYHTGVWPAKWFLEAPAFAAALGLRDQRPDFVVRLDRGPALPRSLQRPAEAVRL